MTQSCKPNSLPSIAERVIERVIETKQSFNKAPCGVDNGSKSLQDTDGERPWKASRNDDLDDLRRQYQSNCAF